MKTSVITFKKIGTDFPSDYIKNAIEEICSCGMDVATFSVMADDDAAAFRRRLSEERNTADNLIVLVPYDISFDIKSEIAEEMNTDLTENETAKEIVLARGEEMFEEYSENYYSLPSDATIIPNDNGAFQGFMSEDDEFTLVVLPQDFSELKPMISGYVLPYFDKKYKAETDKFVFKYLGDGAVLKNALLKAEDLYGKPLKKSVRGRYDDYLCNVIFGGADEKKENEVKRFLAETLGDGMYAQFDTTLGERLFDLLKLRSKRISVAESFTGGRVVSALIANSGASEFVTEGIVAYSNLSKMKRLDVKKEELAEFGAVSSRVAYKMAVGLLLTGECDLAISTTGIAGPKSDDTDKPVGLNYIGVGTKDGVHVYKFEFKGTREEITETAKNHALFLAIKKLKNI